MSLAVFLSLVSCTTVPPSTTPTPKGLRSIIIDGDTLIESESGEFKSWYCKDYIKEGPILVEVGFFDKPKFEGLGFILYDGGNSGDLASYQRTGLEHRWDWGPEGVYSFVIKTDGTGAYYNFSTVPKGETTKPSAIYKCYKR